MMINGLRVLDKEFGQWLVNTFAADTPQDTRRLCQQLATAVSYALHLKHSSLDLSKTEGLGDTQLNSLLRTIDSTTVSALPDNIVAPQSTSNTPKAALVRSINGQHIWLQKYYLFERDVAQNIRALAAAPVEEISPEQESLLETFFPAAERNKNKGQLSAARTALNHRFAMITGGPGTGKTYTVARIISLLKKNDAALRIKLAAPTGKAAKRMMESLQGALENADSSVLPANGSTLHSLLGIYRHTPKPRFNRENPLDLDVLIVDEASMVDLPMMARILDALPEHARLILLGDKDQLHSVEAGGVLAELCESGPGSVYGTDAAPIAYLEHNYRSTRAIQALAQQVNAGEAIDVRDHNDDQNEVCIHTVSPGRTEAQPAWLETATSWYEEQIARIKTGAPPDSLLSAQSRFQLLCALRNGTVGVAQINRKLELSLGRHYEPTSSPYDASNHQAWFPGLPVMVLTNDHERKIYNGDIGLVLPVIETDGGWQIDTELGTLRACFLMGEDANGEPDLKTISQAQMPPFESCFALTVHKSQGSEYDHVIMVLPDETAQIKDNPVITRELLYTGITRARQQLDIWSGGDVLKQIVDRRTIRMSGLAHHHQQT